MQKLWRSICSGMAVLAIFGATFGAGYHFGGLPAEEAEFVETTEEVFDLKLPGEAEKRVVTLEEVEGRLVALSQFATYSDVYEVEKQEEQSRCFIDDIQIPGTTNSIKIKCNGVVKVGYDVSKIQPRIDNDSLKIYFALPQPTVLDNYAVWDSLVCEETNCILNPIDFEQYQMLITEIEAKGLEDAEQRGIYLAAEEQFKTVIRGFLSGFEDYEIVFL